MTTRPFLVGIAGGSGSGKTTVAERLAELIGDPSLSLLRLDSYYCDRGDLPLEARASINYDHPDAFDWKLLIAHLDSLAAGEVVDVPLYDFATHERLAARSVVSSAQVIVVEGILVLHEPDVRERFDLRVFVDTDPDVRFIRRLERDVAERGRSLASVIDQYLATVRPSHEEFVEPSKRHADVIVPHGGRNEPAVEMLVARVRQQLRNPG